MRSITEIDSLKPCPFCGGNDLYYDNSDDRSGGEWIACNACEFEFKVPYTFNKRQWVQEKWNTRHPTITSDAMNALISRLEAIKPSASSPELSEHAYRQAVDDCIAIIRQLPALGKLDG
jgi:Lar family restriction alleviation protein